MKYFIERVKENILTEDEVLQDVWLTQILDFPFIPASFTNELVAFAKNHEAFRKKLLLNGEGFEKDAQTISLLMDWIAEFPTNKKHLITGFLKNTPTHILLQFEEQLAPYMPTGYFDVLNRIRVMEIEGTEEDLEPLWELFGELLADLDLKFNQSTYFTAKKVQDMLIRLGEYDATEVSYILRDELQEDFISINGILAVRAVGLMELHEHVPKLVQLLERDEEDILLEEVCEALIRLQTDEAVKLIAPQVVDADRFIFATAILKQIKTSLAENVLADAYGQTDDVDIQESIIEALVGHFSEATFDAIEHFVDRGEYGYLIDMDELFYGFFKAMKREHPLLETWRAEAVERNEFFEDEMKSMDTKEIIREQFGKVGRNDPCICGSGKKFKKCCG